MLIEKDGKLNSLLEKIQVAIVIHDADTKITNYNKRALELLGLTEKQILGKKSIDPEWKFFSQDGVILKQGEYPADTVINSKSEVKDMISSIYRPLQKDIIDVIVNAVPEFDLNGNVSEVIVTFVDITEQRKLEKTVRESERDIASVLNNSQDGIVRTDRNFRHIYANPALLNAVGLSKEQYIGKTNREIGFPEELCSYWRRIHEYVFQKKLSKTSEFSFPTVNRKERIFQAITSPEFNENGKVETIITIIRDITDLKKTEAEKNAVIAKLEMAYSQIESMAYTDYLTGLLNRRMMLQQIEYEISRAKREKNTFALLMCDIDFFKEVNDNYGHECGDYVLKDIAHTIEETFRREDKICRWGGEEFLCMIVNVAEDGALACADKLRSAVESHAFSFKQNNLPITITIGVQLFDPAVNMQNQIEYADKKLYRGKQEGRNRVII